MNNRSIFGSTFAFIMGIGTMGFGILEFVGGEWGPLTVEAGTFTGWRAVILICAGLIYLSSVTNFLDIRQLGKTLVASIMIWIVAAMDIWAMIAASIPSGVQDAGEPWFASGAEFLAAYGPPYMPAMYLLLPSLVILYFIGKRRTASQAA
ncbi:MAG: hypothetical protein ACLFPU_08755 [Dehalococcoidia bacterium]